MTFIWVLRCRKDLLSLLVLIMKVLLALRRVPELELRSLSLTVKDGLMSYVRRTIASTEAAAAPLRALVMVSILPLRAATVNVLEWRMTGTLCLWVVIILIPAGVTVAEMIIVLMLLIPFRLRLTRYLVLSVCSVLICWELPVLELSIWTLCVTSRWVKVSTLVFLILMTRMVLGRAETLGPVSIRCFLLW